MARNGSGVYSLPAGSTFSPNTVIESSKVNAVLADLAADNNAARPIVAGGTGATSASGARTNLSVDPARTLATKSANYTALAADKSAFIRFDGSYTLSLTAAASLGANWHCVVIADGGNVTIDPNGSETINGATTLILPDGYSTFVICDGTGFRATEDFIKSDEAFGQCYLSLSGGNLRLSRANGKLLTINGRHEIIPSAGVTLAPTGLTADTSYYIYAYMNAGTMTLEASTTSTAVSSSSGIYIKSGDATRTMVGLARVVAGPAFSDSGSNGLVMSYYNRRRKLYRSVFSANRTTSSGSYTELNTEIRCAFVSFGDEPVFAQASGAFSSSVASSGVFAAISLNGASPVDGGCQTSLTSRVPIFSNAVLSPVAGYNYITLLSKTESSATATFIGGGVDADRTALIMEIFG